MRTSARRVVLSLLLLVFCVAVTSSLSAQGVRPIAAETRVDDPTPFKVREPSVATLGEERVLVVWSNDRFGLFGHFLDDASGSDFVLVANSEFPPNPGRGDVLTRHHPDAVGLSDGGFLLLWTEEDALLRASIFYYEFDVHDRDVYAQHFDASGQAQGQPFRINDDSAGFQSRPRGVALDDDRVAVTWETENAVFARVVDARGVNGPQVRVNQIRASAESRPGLARDPAGRVLVTWTGRDGSGTGVFARLFDSDLVALSDEVVVNADTRSHQRFPSVTASRAGGFLLAWQGRSGEPGEWRIFARPVGGDGVPTGSEQLISGDFGEADNSATVVTTQDGRYLALWLNWIRPFATFVGGVELGATGQAVSEIFQVSSAQPLQQWRMDAAVTASGSIVATWSGFADGKSLGVSARRLEGPAALEPQRARD
jgi:hypothetical protein